MGDKAELEKDIESAQQAVTDAVKKLTPYMGDFPSDLADAIRKLAAWASAYASPEEPPAEEERLSSVGKKSRKKSKEAVRKAVPLWPSLGMLNEELVKADPADDDGSTDGAELRRGVSKQARGQGDQSDDGGSGELWPSL